MLRRFRLLAIATVSSLASTLLAMPALAAGPQISVISINKTSVTPGESIRIDYRITDDGSCCRPHDVYMYDPAGAWVTRVQGNRVSGTDQNSNWSADITVPANSAGQNWGAAIISGSYSFRTQTTDSDDNYSDLVLLGTVSVGVAASTPAPTPTPTGSASPTPTPTVSASPSASPSPVQSVIATPMPVASPSPTPSATASQTSSAQNIAPSKVGGILRVNTTFARLNSPYQLTSTIQIPEGVTIEVEPGVVINGALVDLMFLVQGRLVMSGSRANPVRLTGKPKAFLSNKGSKATAKIELNGVSFEGGGSIMPPTGSSGDSTFMMSNCEVVDVNSYTYLAYPGGTSIIEKSAFRNSAGFSVGFDAREGSNTGFKRVIFRNNLFSGPSVSGYWILNWAAYGSSLEVEGNSFIGGPYTALKVIYDSSKINASQNYWGTSNSAVIQDMILDQNDDLEYKSIINVGSPLSAHNPITPSTFDFGILSSAESLNNATSSGTAAAATALAAATAAAKEKGKKPTSSEPAQVSTPLEEIEVEAEEEYEPYIEAKVVGGKTRFLISANPKTRYRVEASLRGKKKSFSVVTNSDGEVAFRSSLNLKGYRVKLVYGGQTLISATVE